MLARNPDSLLSFIAWLETKDPNEKYDYCAPGDCLLAQYLQAMGSPDYWLTHNGVREAFDGHGQEIVHPSSDRDTWAFGAALERARAIIRRG